MATISLQCGHGHHKLLSYLANISSVKFSINTSGSDDLCLVVPGVVRLTSFSAILKYLISLSPHSDLYPKDYDIISTAHNDCWIDVSTNVNELLRLWKCNDGSTKILSSRSDIKTEMKRYLFGIESRLKDNTYLASDTKLMLADLYSAIVLKQVFEEILEIKERRLYSSVIRWLETILNSKVCMAAALGKINLSQERPSDEIKKVVSSKNTKEKISDTRNSNMKIEDSLSVEEDGEKKAKKAAKAKAKEDKKMKAQTRKESNVSRKTENLGNSKKAQAKKEAEEKRREEEAETQKIISLLKAIPKGEKKDLNIAMPKTYCPQAVEATWYDWWDKCGFFKPNTESTKPNFVMVIPPPNVTGALHIGHALTNTVEDMITRWKRMSGYNTLWVPGTDHAGIATQTVVEKSLQKERNLTRHNLGREEFLKVVYEWVGKYSDKIREQLMRIGSSVDWTRKRFTMDEIMSKAVLEAFITFHEKGLIYRDNRLVNWCCKLRTALSDIEVDYIDILGRTLLSIPGYDKQVEVGVLTSFAYPLEDDSGEIIVATTRVETMLGDTAVAVHPDDPRYTSMKGKYVVHPVNGRKLPIIMDSILVDMTFGTGAVKITPAHDPNDYATGKRHNLEFINVIDDEGRINEFGGPFKGQHRFDARISVVEFLKEKGLFRGIQENPMRIGLCSRSKDIIEPALKPQWWVDCKDMATKACQAVRDGELKIIPKEFESTWYRWLENIRDWCISRQLWWGHRIPAYYVIFSGESSNESGEPGYQSERFDRWIIAKSKEEAEIKAKEKFPNFTIELRQDEDVLDTWFSSGLFPFSVMGWPEDTVDFGKFYPTSLLETGHDILFFWVARMVMMGINLTGKVPFQEVYLHPMIRDAHGRKMSKSLGNVIDPIHVIEGISLNDLHKTLQQGNLDPREIEKATAGQKADFPEGIAECGADALRFTLTSYLSQSGDINLDIKRVVAYRHWCNKLWNAIRFAMINLPENFVPKDHSDDDISNYPLSCRWILSRLSRSVSESVRSMESYEFGNATKFIYSFWMDDLCDIFVEVIKPTLNIAEQVETTEVTLQTLWICLDYGLRLLHPFMPFVTEELWQRLPKRSDQFDIASIMIAPYPSPHSGWMNIKMEDDFAYVTQIVSKTRQMRADYGLTPKQKPDLFLFCKDEAISQILTSLALEIKTLTHTANVRICDGVPSGCSVMVFDENVTICLLLKGILDPVKELEKLNKRMNDINFIVEQIKKKMISKVYMEKTPGEVKEKDQEILIKKEAEIESIRNSIATMEKL